MKEGERKFLGDSESFAKSLEPNYEDLERITQDKINSVVDVISTDSEVNTLSEKTPKNKHPLPNKKYKYHNNFHPYRKKRFETVSVIFIIFLFIFIVFLSASTNTNPFIVMLSMLPTIITIVVALLIYESLKDNKHVLWVIPLILSFVFNWYGKSVYSVFPNIDVDVLTALNVIVSFLYLIINYFALQQSIPKEKELVIKEVIKETNIPFELTNFIASIEDKSKALNFVIGRVYNSYHGGTRALREKINMKQEWYDQFSQLPADIEEIDFKALETLITKIEKRLSKLMLTEKEIFGDSSKQFKNLVRDEKGRDKIIDVLDKNDKDPVVSYYDGASQFCGKVRDYVNKKSVPEVRNEYVERPDEKKKRAPRASKWKIKNLFK